MYSERRHRLVKQAELRKIEEEENQRQQNWHETHNKICETYINTKTGILLREMFLIDK